MDACGVGGARCVGWGRGRWGGGYTMRSDGRMFKQRAAAPASTAKPMLRMGAALSCKTVLASQRNHGRSKPGRLGWQ